MTKKNIQKLKKQLMKEELHRQGKATKYKRWILVASLVALAVFSGRVWYQANLHDILMDRFEKGLALKSAGRYEQSCETLKTLAQDYPHFSKAPDALFELAETLDIYLGRYRDALLTYLLLIRDHPETLLAKRAQRQIAEIYKFRLDDCSQAISAYQQVLELEDKDDARLQYEVADCYFRLNNYEQARIEFESFQKNFPDNSLNAEVQYRIAVTYALEGHLQEAESAYRAVPELWPKSRYALEARFGLAAVLEEQERLREALKLLEDLGADYPNQDALERKRKSLRARIDKKKKAI